MQTLKYYEGFDDILEARFSNEDLIKIAEFNALKYLYRYHNKYSDIEHLIEDLNKAKNYIDFIILRLNKN